MLELGISARTRGYRGMTRRVPVGDVVDESGLAGNRGGDLAGAAVGAIADLNGDGLISTAEAEEYEKTARPKKEAAKK